MDIKIFRGTGVGPTSLAAFDAALCEVGIGDYNLIVLSSVIPPGSLIIHGKHEAQRDEWGNRLYVVLARADVEVPGESAWAGIGWAQGEDGRGLFVEEHVTSEQDVRARIRATLGSMIEARGMNDFGQIHDEIARVVCHDAPVCAVVAAVYRSVAW